MLDKNTYVLAEFRGLWHRGVNFSDYSYQRLEEIPDGYNQSANNILFSNKGAQNRPAWVFAQGPLTPEISQIFPTSDQFGSFNLIHDETNGNLYFDNTLLFAGFTSGASTETKNIQVLRLAGLSPFGFTHNHLISGTNATLSVYILTVGLRAAAGLPPASSVTTAAGGVGRIELGLHLISVVYETDTGFITRWAVPTQFNSAGAVVCNLTTIPIGPTGTVKRHIVATKIIRNFNGDVNAYEFFFVPGGSILNNTATILTVSFYDTELVSSADYLLDISSSVTNYRILCTFAGRVVYATHNEVEGSSCVVSEPGQPETINLVDNAINISTVITAWEYEGTLYINTKGGTYGFRDNGGPANTWERFLIDSNVMCLGTHSVPRNMKGESALINGAVLIAAEDGIYAFNGRFENPLSYPVQGLYLKYLSDAKAKSLVTIRVDNQNKYFIVSGFYSISQPVNGRILLYCDYLNGLNRDAVRWATWFTPWVSYRCPAIISQGNQVVIGAGKNAYVLDVFGFSGTNRDEDNTSGAIVKSAISGFISSPLIRVTNDYSKIIITDISATVRIDNNQPNTQNGYYVGLGLSAQFRNYVFGGGDPYTVLFNFNKQFERDYLLWGFNTEESPGGYKVIELIQLVAYWSQVSQARIKK